MPPETSAETEQPSSSGDDEALRYPLGRFEPDPEPTREKRSAWIESLAGAPANLRNAVTGLTEEALDEPYRPGGWTVRQVVHHLPDSHVNGYLRMKWAITEDQPEIKLYDQERWAELADARSAPIEPSLALLESLHERWVRFLESLDDEGFLRTAEHPEEGVVTIQSLVELYAWHGRHHTAQITALARRRGWRP